MPTSDFVATTGSESAARIDGAHLRFADLLARVPDGLPVGSNWTAVEVVAHLVTVVSRYTSFAPSRLADSPRGVDEVNERELADWAGRSSSDLLGVLHEEMTKFRAMWGAESGLPLDAPIPFHGGATIDVQAGLANLLGEYLVHGLDVARAAGEPWAIEDRDGALLCGLATQILPYYVRPDHRDRLVVRFDLTGVAPWILDIDGARATSRRAETDEPVDVELRGPASAAALVFYGRADLADAERLGLAVAGGAHPELAGTLTERLEQP